MITGMRDSATRGRGRAVVAVVLAVLVLTALAGCTKKKSETLAPGPSATATSTGACSQTGGIHFAKTKFLLHAGLAYGAFHRYIYKPYTAGSFAAGAAGRTKAFLKAGAAGLYDVHELHLAALDAKADPTLCHIAAPFDAAATAFSAVAAKLKGGQLDPTDMTSLTGTLDDLQQQASKIGAEITDKSTHL